MTKVDIEEVVKLIPEGSVDIRQLTKDGVYLIAYDINQLSTGDAMRVSDELTKRGVCALLVATLEVDKLFSVFKLKGAA